MKSDLQAAHDWPTVELGELINPGRGISYGVVQPGDAKSDGIPIVRVNDIKNGIIETASPLRIEKSIEEQHKRTRLRGGEILLTLVGTVGQCALVPSTIQGWNVARAIAVLPIRTDIDPRWVLYCIRTPHVQHLIRTRCTTTVQATLNIRDVKQLPIILPHAKVRNAILDILGALDAKINSNRETDHTLDATIRYFYRSAHEHGNHSTKQEWRTSSVYEFADVIYGAPFDSSRFNSVGTGMPLLRIRDLVTNNPYTFTTEEHPKATKVAAGDIVAGMDGQFRIYFWRGPESLMNQRVCMFRPRPKTSRVFLALSLEGPLLSFERGKVGTTVIHLGKSDIDRIRISMPPDTILREFSSIAEPMLDSMITNSQQNKTLTDLRDLLLPKLLSGEIRIKDAEKLVSDAV